MEECCWGGWRWCETWKSSRDWREPIYFVSCVLLLSLKCSTETPVMGSLAPSYSDFCAALSLESSPCLSHYLPDESSPCLLAAPKDVLPRKHCMHCLLIPKIMMSSGQEEQKKGILRDMEENLKRFRTTVLRHSSDFLRSFCLFTEMGSLTDCKESLLENYT